ncbi:MAG: MFS transporter [Candidatus Eremiobacteraeota bacterium]|nr:MFS transporter [Candidatus Eremiobacteraeota bacterium]
MDKLELSGEKRLTVFGLLIGCFLISLDPNLVGIVTPELATDLRATSLYGWIAGAYLIALTVGVPIVGKAVEVYSVRKIYLGSMVVFLIGTALCAVAPDVQTFLAFRVVQGLGAGGIFSTNFAVAAVLFSPRVQGVIMSYFNIASGLAMVAGAVVGGMLADFTTWRAAFWANFVPGLFTLVLLYFKMPEVPSKGGSRMDFKGALTLLGWCTPLMILCSWSPEEGDASLYLGGLLSLLVVSLAAFVMVESRQSEPLLDPKLLKHPVSRWGALAAWTVGAFTTSSMVYVPLFAVEGQDLSATYSSALLVCQTVFAIGGSVVGGRLLLKFGKYKPMMLASSFSCTAILLWLGERLGLQTPFWELLLIMAGLGLSFGILMPLYPLAVQNSVEPDRVASASSAVQFFQMLGSSMGAALTGLLLSVSLNASFPALVNPHVKQHLLAEHHEGYAEKDSLQDQLKANIENLREALKEAREGNSHAEQDIRDNPFVPERVREMVLSGQPIGDQELQRELEELAADLEQLIDDVVDDTIIAALQIVYRALAALGLLTFIFTLLIPSLPLRDKTHPS